MNDGFKDAPFDAIGEANEFEQLKGEKANLAKALRDTEMKHSVSTQDITKSNAHYPLRTFKRLSSNSGPRQAALDNR